MNHHEHVTTPPPLIALGKLIRSPRNARRTASRDACEEMKASILAHGLMQNLVVTDPGDGYYLVVAGARRLSALTELQSEGKLPEDFAVPCQVVTEERALEMSLAENTVRLGMHPADEFEAFATLAGQGEPAAAIAARFGADEKHVLQRLKLGNAAPELLKEYRDGHITLDALMAFTLTDDRDKQLKVYASLQGWQKGNPRHIRDCLTEAMAEADSKLAKFVGLDAYQAAGGATRCDLFGEDVYLENPELLNALAGEKLKLIEQGLKAEGWGWVEVNPERDWSAVSACGLIHPLPVGAPAELADEQEALLATAAGINDRIDATDDEDELATLSEASHENQDRLEQTARSLARFVAYDPEQMKTAGCYVSIGHDGALCVEKGLVRRQDMKHLAAPDDAKERKPKAMPETLRRDLEAYRLQVAQAEIARHPAIAFDLLAFHAARSAIRKPAMSGLDVHFGEQCPAIRRQQTAAGDALEAIGLGLPLAWASEESEAGQFKAFSRLPESDKHRLLAYCVALTLKPKLAPADGEEPTAYDAALSLTGADVAGYWRPAKDNYLSRITRDQLLAIGREALGDPWAQSRARDKKVELVEQLDRAFAAPEQQGRTPEQAETLKRWLPAGMGFGIPATRQTPEADDAREAA